MMDDIAKVVHRELCNAATAIALGLGAEPTVLDDIRSKSCEDRDCLQGVAIWWIEKEGAKPRWSVLVEVLKSKAVGELELAKKVEIKWK